MRVFSREFTEAEVLQVSAIVVAAPRYMGAFASAVGVSIVTHWPAFVTIEILSGLAMAVLEGWALAFTFKRWRKIPRYTFDWYVLGVILAILLLALPGTATPYLVSSQLGKPVAEIIPITPTFFLWLWSFLIAAIAPLVVAAVGYADDEAITMARVKGAASKVVNRTVKRQPEPATTPGQLTPQQAEKQERLEQFDRVRQENPKMTKTELANLLGVSRGTIRNYEQELTVGANGNGAH